MANTAIQQQRDRRPVQPMPAVLLEAEITGADEVIESELRRCDWSLSFSRGLAAGRMIRTERHLNRFILDHYNLRAANAADRYSSVSELDDFLNVREALAEGGGHSRWLGWERR